jgi:type I restriction enzyme S subunit
MRDSGVPWLGEVPEHWEVRRLKNVLRERDARSATGTEQLLRVSQYTGVTERLRADGLAEPDSRAESLVGYKRAEPGELVVNIMLAWNGSMGVSPFAGIASPAYCVYRFDPGTEPWYFHHLLRSPAYKARIKAVSTGVVESRLRLYTDDLYRLEALSPPLPEQAAIVRFLDHADRRIRRYIRAKQKLIKLLEEQKQAIIHRAVTRGLDPNVRLKPSGVEWLGDVPEHWEVLPLKRWVSTEITDGPHETPQWLDDGVPFVSAEAMVGGRLDFSRRRGFISRELHEAYCRKCRPQRDDIFMCKSGATTGKLAIVETDDEFSIWSPLALIRVSPERVSSRLLFAVLQSSYVQRQVQGTWSYGTQPNLSMAAMERVVVVLPPLKEQIDLLAYLDQMTKTPSKAIDRAQREIDLLREYRTRLIADVVTGKLDVREAAARLPDEAQDLEPLDDTDAITGAPEGTADELDATPAEAGA